MASDKFETVDPCVCAICASKIDFDLDPHILREIESHNCVVFAGAGISTETRYTHPNSFYDQLRADLEFEGDLPFPQLVDKFQARPNGRIKLIDMIVERFNYIDSFRELRDAATRFHQALATMPYFKTVITTNWDRYFEDEIGATPFVYEGDVPFWEKARRSVLKIHGSIDNYSSIVASSEDYVECEERLRNGAIGAVLKQIFATKTCIFFGYSATDPDFLNIYNAIRIGLGKVARTHYLVSPFLSAEDLVRLSELNIIGINTDATYFLETIKSHMCTSYCFAEDEIYDHVFSQMLEVIGEHTKYCSSFKVGKHPHLMFCAVYQDGLIHALQRILDLRKSGVYSDLHHVRRQIFAYSNEVDGHIKKRDYWESSYFTGYLNGLFFFDLKASGEDCDDVPRFYHPGVGELDKGEFDQRVRKNPEIHKGALAQARRLVKNRPQAEVLQHLPWG